MATVLRSPLLLLALLLPTANAQWPPPSSSDVDLVNGTNDTNTTATTTATAPATTTALDPAAWAALNCGWDSWGNWSTCECDAPTQFQFRRRAVLWHTPPYSAACMLLTEESRSCYLSCQAEPTFCEWAQWGTWTDCSQQCGGGKRERERYVYKPGLGPCLGPAFESQGCQVGMCAQPFLLAWVGATLTIIIAFAVWVLLRRRRRRVKPTLQDEEGSEAPGTAWLEGLPDYWASKRRGESSDFHELLRVDAALYSTFEALLRETYQGRCTQDRPCPNGRCPRTQRGCPCVQPGGTPGLPLGYRLAQVLRVESAGMWLRYARRRADICTWREAEGVPRFEPPLRSARFIDAHPAVFEPLDTFANEAYAFHGTSVRKALAIGQEDYRIDPTGNGMYGAGTYLAESCTKADEYARQEPGGAYGDTLAMVLSRVCMGRFFYTTQRDSSARAAVLGGDFDSTLGDREASAGTFRELVLYDTDQVYPEYILLYRRVYKGDTETIAPPLHMELPLYWRSCHRDLSSEEFLDQYRVRRSTLEVLQLLVNKSLSGWQVVGAKRVENSWAWSRFAKVKEQLRSAWEEEAENLESPPKGVQDVLTSCLLSGASFAQRVLSVEHLDLNEHWLWHGTCKAAAESIALRGFSIPLLAEVENGKRFGRGLYFAESLDKALAYAGERGCVLLCRVACGRPYCTESQKEPEAHVHAMQHGKDCVLASPGGYGPREFVVLQEDQAYPEYILEMEPSAVPPTLPHVPEPLH